jgi:hypothetical protein|tara:strand:- start:3070 stop:3267 length:198 start_codon:yes stop_codon:yes gene_type:complete
MKFKKGDIVREKRSRKIMIVKEIFFDYFVDYYCVGDTIEGEFKEKDLMKPREIDKIRNELIVEVL